MAQNGPQTTGKGNTPVKKVRQNNLSPPLGVILWVHLIRGYTPACGLISPSGFVCGIFSLKKT